TNGLLGSSNGTRPLTRRKYRQYAIVTHIISCNRSSTKARGGADFCICISELAGHAMYMQMVNSSQAIKRLVSGDGYPQCRMTVHGTVAVTMPVDHQWRGLAKCLQRRQPDPVHADHDTTATLFCHQVGMPAHGIDLIADVECDHDIASATFTV